MQQLDRLLLNRHVERFRAAAGILSGIVFLWGLVAGPDTSARRRLDEAAKAARAVEEWLKKNRYGT